VTFTFDAELWRYQHDNPWYFLTLPVDDSQRIREETDGLRKGFGSVRVEATIGASTWRTSVFPDSKSQCFVLPVKKQVRRSEHIEDGDVCDVVVTLLINE
jgi:Domain of unknown function (DUF1905)